MILEDEEIQERIESPLNLLNRLRSTTKKAESPSLPSPNSKEIIDDLDEKIKYGAVRGQAAAIMSSALTELQQRIPDVQKPEKLAQIAAEMNKVLISRQDQDKQLPGQLIIYAPRIVDETHFNTIVVRD
jgi:hypothetical protein